MKKKSLIVKTKAMLILEAQEFLIKYCTGCDISMVILVQGNENVDEERLFLCC